MTELLCPGSHNTAHPAPALRPEEHLCRSCVHHTDRVLGDLVALVHDLETTISRQNRGARNTGRTIGHAQPLPVDVTTSQKARASLELLFEWADFVATRTGLTGLPVFAQHLPLDTLVPRAVAILQAKIDWIRLDEQGPDLASAIRYIRRDLRRLVDTRLDRLHAGPCNADLGYPPELHYRCQVHLYRAWGSNDITCDGYTPHRMPGTPPTYGCGTTHTTDERRAWLRAEVENQLLPLKTLWADLYEIVPGCDLEWETVRKWTHAREQRIAKRDTKGRPREDARGRPMVTVIRTPPRLEPQAWNGNTPLYRGADVLRLVEDTSKRRGRRRRTRRNVA